MHHRKSPPKITGGKPTRKWQIWQEVVRMEICYSSLQWKIRNFLVTLGAGCLPGIDKNRLGYSKGEIQFTSSNLKTVRARPPQLHGIPPYFEFLIIPIAMSLSPSTSYDGGRGRHWPNYNAIHPPFSKTSLHSLSSRRGSGPKTDKIPSMLFHFWLCTFCYAPQ